MSSAQFLARVQRFQAFGTPTVEMTQDGIPYLINEFWTASQRQAQAIHEISYRTCFKPQLPAFFIAGLTDEGEAVLDPFMGLGTTPVQAALMGRRPIGASVLLRRWQPACQRKEYQHFCVRGDEALTLDRA